MKIGGELNKVNEAQFNVIIFGEKYWHGELLITRENDLRERIPHT